MLIYDGFTKNVFYTLISDHDVVIVTITNTQHICGHTVPGTWVHKLLCSLKVLLQQNSKRNNGREQSDFCSWHKADMTEVYLVYLLTFSWNGHFRWSQSYRALFLKAPATPPWLLWTEAIVMAFRTISIIPVPKTVTELIVKSIMKTILQTTAIQYFFLPASVLKVCLHNSLMFSLKAVKSSNIFQNLKKGHNQWWETTIIFLHYYFYLIKKRKSHLHKYKILSIHIKRNHINIPT